MLARVEQSQLVGIGLYGATEAARLTGATVSQVRKWLLGSRSSIADREPLWSRQIANDDLGLTLGFLDLVQLRIARAFIEAGLSAQKVRRAISAAQTIKGHTHPLACSDFRTDGATVFLRFVQDDGEEKLIDLFKDGQFVMKKIIAPSLKGIEYDADVASRWRPLAAAPRIVLDPARQFGAPIDEESGVPTRLLVAAVDAEGSIGAAAKVYRVSEQAIRQAVAFEKKLAA
jgi:uncharacterized protein (DUF433 family)